MPSVQKAYRITVVVEAFGSLENPHRSIPSDPQLCLARLLTERSVGTVVPILQLARRNTDEGMGAGWTVQQPQHGGRFELGPRTAPSQQPFHHWRVPGFSFQ